MIEGLGLGRGTPGGKSGKDRGAEARGQSKHEKRRPVLSIPDLPLAYSFIPSLERSSHWTYAMVSWDVSHFPEI